MKNLMKAGAALLMLTALPSHATDKVTFDVTGKILKGTCSFASDSLLFELGEVEMSQFTGVGAKTPFVTQSLVSSGCDADVTGLRMTFQATADSTLPNTFAVSGGAKGVAIELFASDNVQAIPDNTTQMRWSVRPAGGTYDFKARYRQTLDQVVPGEANANIIVNITYP